MLKRERRKRQKQQRLLCMIVVGMMHPAMIFAAAGFAAANRGCE
jgi:hypothetical protein